jgi:hypothetical protein
LLPFAFGIIVHAIARYALLRHNVEQEEFGESEGTLQPAGHLLNS